MLAVNLHELAEGELNEAAAYYAGARRGLGAYSTVLLAEILVAGGGLPMKARVDALHVAMAAVHGMDYLLTWNCTHIANAVLRGRIEGLCRAAGFEPPVICTPLELPQEESE